MLTPEELEARAAEIPEDGFRNLLPLIMQSFDKNKGRTLDPIQVGALALALLEMSATIDAQVTYIGQLQQEIEEWKTKEQEKSRLWTPQA